MQILPHPTPFSAYLGCASPSNSSLSEEQDSDAEENSTKNANGIARNNFQVYPLCILYTCMLRSNYES
jgi:hypothetical protein